MRALILLKTAEGGRWSVSPATALAARGHDVIFALPSDSGALPDLVRSAGMEVVVAKAPLLDVGVARQASSVCRLRRQVQTMSVDVVVSHLYVSALAGRFALARSGIPHVYVAAGPLYLENALIRLAERFLCRLDAHLVCSSGHLLERYRRLGVPSSQLSMIPYGTPTGWDDPAKVPSREAARMALGLVPDEFVVVCIALFYAPKRLVHRGRGIKGHDVLLEAWHLYRRSGGRGTLLVVGGGFGPGGEPYRSQLMSKFAELESVRWIPIVDDVRPYYRASDVSVSPSLSENLGAPAEASKLAVPSVASRVGGLPEIVVDGWNGWLVPPSDSGAVARALHKMEALGLEGRSRFGERARLRAMELCNQERNGEAFADVMERLVGNADARQPSKR